MIKKGTAIIEHLQAKQKMQLVDKDGRMILGGAASTLHRKMPWKSPWGLSKDGDLWQHFHGMVQPKSPDAVKLTKVKGHVTRHMVADGLVDACDQEGNDEADIAARRWMISCNCSTWHVYMHAGRRHIKASWPECTSSS